MNFCSKKRFFKKKNQSIQSILKKYKHIDDFGVSDAIDKIFVRMCKLDFGPA